MARKDVKKVLVKALFDLDFANRVMVNPDEELAKYDLTNEEISLFKGKGDEFYALVEDTFVNETPPVYRPPTTTTTTTTTTTRCLIDKSYPNSTQKVK